MSTATARKEQLLAAALPVAQRVGYLHMTRGQIGAAAKVSPALITHHFGSLEGFRAALMRYAVECCCLRVIAQGVVACDDAVADLSDDVKERALAELLNSSR